jgi:hypothetical protein
MTFEADWGAKAEAGRPEPTPGALKRKLKGMVKKLSPLDPEVKEAVDDGQRASGRDDERNGGTSVSRLQ